MNSIRPFYVIIHLIVAAALVAQVAAEAAQPQYCVKCVPFSGATPAMGAVNSRSMLLGAAIMVILLVVARRL